MPRSHYEMVAGLPEAVRVGPDSVSGRCDSPSSDALVRLIEQRGARRDIDAGAYHDRPGREQHRTEADRAGVHGGLAQKHAVGKALLDGH